MNSPSDNDILKMVIQEQLAELQAARDYVESAAERVEWYHIELAAARADNSDLERENRRMRWALSVRMSDDSYYHGRTLLDEYLDTTPEFWERQGL